MWSVTNYKFMSYKKKTNKTFRNRLLSRKQIVLKVNGVDTKL